MDTTKYSKFSLYELQIIWHGAVAASGEAGQAAYNMCAEINEYLGGDGDFINEPDWNAVPTVFETGDIDHRALAKMRRDRKE